MDEFDKLTIGDVIQVMLTMIDDLRHCDDSFSLSVCCLSSMADRGLGEESWRRRWRSRFSCPLSPGKHCPVSCVITTKTLVRLHTHSYTRTYAHTHTHLHTHLHTHTHTHTP